jgi:predicted house-cleaning NTP pyrophosphatase (Maf/HAM1 superfamily)
MSLLSFLPSSFPIIPPAFANPADYAQKNAELKAHEVATKLFAAAAAAAEADGGEKKTIIVIGSDTMYVP